MAKKPTDKPKATETAQKLRLAIQNELKNCDERAYPNINRIIRTPEGYQRIENLVIANIVNQSLGVGAAIALVESELS